ncbi:hypothetical protein E2C01_047587 [Portunus trituberculatus]|uniref:Uncharacterized protein n=1 Tax=Portunus trituberculatus TaxID=210409 RepID=A0A5B7G7V7_PORTR|nr:hypothetical protein [Portunus trituberculatus]
MPTSPGRYFEITSHFAVRCHLPYLTAISVKGGRVTEYLVVRYRSSEPRNADSLYPYFRAKSFPSVRYRTSASPVLYPKLLKRAQKI